MFWLIENKEQFQEFKNRNPKEAFIEIIPYSPYIHPVENSICCIYIRLIQDYKGYLLPIFHTEVQENLFEDQVYHLLKGLDKIYCRDKKEFLHYFPFKQLIDITLTSPTYIQYTSAHEFLYHKYPYKTDINTIVPIVKHYEYCESLFEELEHLIDKPVNAFYNDKASWVFNGIERSGLFVDNMLYNDYFDKDIEGNVIYTQYNIKTTTTRPSNNFNNINYAALNKENGCRKSFIARNSKLVEFDISAYHVVLAAKLIDFDFGDKDIHQSFAEMYGVDYKTAKELTFKQLYGGVFSEYKDLEFFRKIQAYIDIVWETFQTTGLIECPISNHIYYKEKLENMNPQKLFNYILQNLETTVNIYILWSIFKILKHKKTKIVLYTYDAFLFDWDENEQNILEEINKIFNKHKLTVKVKYGTSYDFEPTI